MVATAISQTSVSVFTDLETLLQEKGDKKKAACPLFLLPFPYLFKGGLDESSPSPHDESSPYSKEKAACPLILALSPKTYL